MEISFTTRVDLTLKEIKKKQPKLFQKIQKKLYLFQTDPTHSSLRNHKLSGNLKNSWSISLEDDFRMLYRYSDNGVVFFKIGKHDQVYK